MVVTRPAGTCAGLATPVLKRPAAAADDYSSFASKQSYLSCMQKRFKKDAIAAGMSNEGAKKSATVKVKKARARYEAAMG